MDIDMLPGCCGASVFFGFNAVQREHEDDHWCSRFLARLMVQAEITEEAFRRPVVMFVHSSNQDAQEFSPKSFADWLKRRKEQITEVSTHHARHGTDLIAYTWIPSDAARRRLRKEIVKIGGTDVRAE